MSTAGDVNQDGYDDVIIGSFTEFPQSGPGICCGNDCDPDDICNADYPGAAFLYLGSADGLADCRSWMIEGTAPPSQQLGTWVAGGGDMDGDGYDDWLIGADGSKGYVYFGGPSLVISQDTDQDGACGALDCDEGNPFCANDCLDFDLDGYCANFDCNDSNPLCTNDCTDADLDGYCVTTDCNESDGGLWQIPGNVTALFFEADRSTLSWQTPASPGGIPGSLSYDTLRSLDPTDFVAGVGCVEVDDGADLMAEDTETPPDGQTYFYVIRPHNECGQGPIGADSSGVPRIAGSCGS